MGSAQNNDMLKLFEKYLNNTCSKEELEQLLSSAKEESGDLFKALQLQWAEANEKALPDETDWDKLFNRMMAKAKETSTAAVEPKEAKVYPVGRAKRNFVTGIAAAASVVLVLFATLYLLLTRNDKITGQAPPAVQTVTAITPGGNKALLTLADGRKIVLDTASNGALTTEGGVKVIKTDGKLAYNTAVDRTTVLYNTVATPKGGQYQLVLADGSKVWLNAASSLRFPTAFNDSARSVELTGEGYFEVAHDPDKAFHVKVNGMDVQVLGTRFNVNAYDDEETMKTTLLQGRVKVTKGEKAAFLSPGQQAVVENKNGSNGNVAVENGVDVEEVVAWKNGRFQFNGAGIESIMRQAARWYDAEVVYEGRTTETFSGGLPRTGQVSQLLKIMEATGKVTFEIKGRQITVKTSR